MSTKPISSILASVVILFLGFQSGESHASAPSSLDKMACEEISNLFRVRYDPARIHMVSEFGSGMHNVGCLTQAELDALNFYDTNSYSTPLDSGIQTALGHLSTSQLSVDIGVVLGFDYYTASRFIGKAGQALADLCNDLKEKMEEALQQVEELQEEEKECLEDVDCSSTEALVLLVQSMERVAKAVEYSALINDYCPN